MPLYAGLLKTPFLDQSGTVSRAWWLALQDLGIADNNELQYLLEGVIGAAIEPINSALMDMRKAEAVQHSAEVDQLRLEIADLRQAVSNLMETQQSRSAPELEIVREFGTMSEQMAHNVAITGGSITGVDTVAAITHAATSKATPVDGDELPLVDSAASNVLKKLTWANLKATLATWINGGLIPARLTVLKVNGTSTNPYAVAFGPTSNVGWTNAADSGSGAFMNYTASTNVINVIATGFYVGGQIRTTVAGGYLSSDSSAGITTTITSASLTGKTITVKDGLITGFA